MFRKAHYLLFYCNRGQGIGRHKEENPHRFAALAEVGLDPRLEASGGGSDANVFFENGISAIPVGIGVRNFHTKQETANISEVLQGVEMSERIICGV